MASKKQQRKAQKAWKKKYSSSKKAHTNLSKIDKHLSSKPNTTSMSADIEQALAKDRQERERRLNEKVQQERTFEEKRTEQDIIDKRNAEAINVGDIIMGEVQTLIDLYPRNGSEYLNNLLKSEINRYGEKAVLYALANAPVDLVELARHICYYEEDSMAMHRALEKFSLVIRGSLPTEEEAKELGVVMDSITHLTKDYED